MYTLEPEAKIKQHEYHYTKSFMRHKSKWKLLNLSIVVNYIFSVAVVKVLILSIS